MSPNSFCAVAPDLENNPANESVRFIMVTEISMARKEEIDDYQNIVPKGVESIKGHFLEKIQSGSKGILESKKMTYFYKETIRFPYVQFSSTKKGFLLSMTEYVDVLNSVESWNQ